MTTICAKPKQTKQFVVASNALTYNPCPARPELLRHSDLGSWPIITQRSRGWDVNYVCKLCVKFGQCLNFSAVLKDGERDWLGIGLGGPRTWDQGPGTGGCPLTKWLHFHFPLDVIKFIRGSRSSAASRFGTPCALCSIVPAPFYTLWHIIGINMATCSWWTRFGFGFRFRPPSTGLQGASWQSCDLFDVSDKAFN